MEIIFTRFCEFSSTGTNYDEMIIQWESAIFINVIRGDKSFDDDGARKACIAIFKFLGEEHEVTVKHRRDFGSALYI